MRSSIILLSLLIAISSQAQIQWQTVKTENGEFQFKAIYHASMAFKINGGTILVDPHGDDDIYKEIGEADLILVSDIHHDHYDEKLLERITSESTAFIAPRAVVEMMPHTWKEKTRSLGNDQSTEFSDLKITAFPMYNFPEGPEAYHVKGRGNGYFIEWKGFKIYISGDTGNIPEMASIKDVDVAFICMNQPYTMTVEDAASAVNTFKPKIVYPYHYRNGDKTYSDIKRFCELVSNSETKCVLLDWYAN